MASLLISTVAFADERRDAVYARGQDITIRVGDIEDAIAALPAYSQQRLREPAELRRFAEVLLRFALLEKEARRRGLDRNAASREALRDHAVSVMLRERFASVTISDADVATYYESHAANFHTAETRRAAHILLTTREEAEALLQAATSCDLQRFRALAREHSIDTETKLRGGDLRYFTANGTADSAHEDDAPVDEVLARAAFNLATVGDVSGIVQVGEHFSIVKLTGLRPSSTRTLTQAREEIRAQLLLERRETALQAWVSSLRRSRSAESYPERVRELTLPQTGAMDELPDP